MVGLSIRPRQKANNSRRVTLPTSRPCLPLVMLALLVVLLSVIRQKKPANRSLIPASKLFCYAVCSPLCCYCLCLLLCCPCCHYFRFGFPCGFACLPMFPHNFIGSCEVLNCFRIVGRHKTNFAVMLVYCSVNVRCLFYACSYCR